MDRRRALASLSTLAFFGPTATLPVEARMTPDFFLARHTIGESLFPELQLPRQAMGVRVQLAGPPNGDPRLPLKPPAVALVAMFVMEDPPEPPPGQRRPDWLLSFEQPDAQGRPQRVSVPVVEPPQDGNVVQSKRNGPPTPLPPGVTILYRGAWWTDLTPLIRTAGLRKGQALELSFVQQRVGFVL